jgi:ubiquinone/menaquinone biosynthesis C-methylase UbiE
LPEWTALEFTGERVIPGLVDPNLFNEHLARYRFAALFAEGARVLDAGCGSGYGTAEFTHAISVVAVDVSAEAVAHARRTFSRPAVQFLQGALEALPFADGSFDLLVAFEVIEHLERWQEMLAEARRVLSPSGVLLVSTPNKTYYSEMRAAAGPNPYHAHEFEYREFQTALEAVFPYVRLWNQNHTESIALVPASPSKGTLDAPADTAPDQAHFFVAACSQAPIAETRAFAWLPSAGNVLREREHHIALLESELRQKNEWLAQTQASHARLLEVHDEALAELEKSNEWAGSLNTDLDTARALITQLQQELDLTHAGYRERIAQLEAEALSRLGWVRDLESQIERGRTEIARAHTEIERLDHELSERTQWAQSLDAELDRLRIENARIASQLQILGHSKWVRLGQELRVAPPVGRE